MLKTKMTDPHPRHDPYFESNTYRETMVMQAISGMTGAAPVHRRWAVLGWRVVLALTVFVAGPGGCKPDSGQSRKASRTSSSTSADGRPRNVLLISMDTTRADYLGCYGHSVIRTPSIDRLAAEGTLFLQCGSAAPITLPSHSTMMTGVYPHVHGVRDNGSYHLHSDNRTLAEALQEAGYFTAAEVAAFVLNREFGLDQGFGQYRDKYSGSRTDITELTTSNVTYRRGAAITDSVLALLEEPVEEPFFLFAHYFDPHQPYEPPEPFRHQYSEPYHGEIAYADAQIGRLIEGLDESGFGKNTLVILTSDHGEGRWQHGEETHASFIYDSTMLVPLIFRCPGLVPSGRRISAQVRLVDIAPTVLDYLAVSDLPDAQGTSLVPLITGEQSDLHLAAYSESLYPFINYGLSHLRALRRGGWKYIHAPKPELYHVEEDPNESNNLIDEHPQRAEQMREDLRTLLAESPSVIGAGSAQTQLSEEALASLRALGYVGGSAVDIATNGPANELDRFDPVGEDPKDHVEFITKVSCAVGLVLMEHPDAEKALRECIERAPNPDDSLAWAYMLLSGKLVESERHEEAVEWFERALRVNPTDARTWTALGQSLAHLGRFDEALAAHEKALQCKPIFARTHYTMASALAATGQVDNALAHCRKALEIDPHWGLVHRTIGRMCSRNGRIKEAMEAYERAVELTPDNAEWHHEFADLLLHERRTDEASKHYRRWQQLAPEEAIESYRRALELDSESVVAYDALGQLLLETGQTAEAVTLLQRGLGLAPNHPNMANNLAWALATAQDEALRDGAEAVKWAKIACRETKEENVNLLDTLAAAYAEAGRFDDAVAAAERAVDLARQNGETDRAARITARLRLYENRQPFTEQ